MRILSLCARPIWPAQDGGIVREHNLIRELAKLARVTVIALNTGPSPAEVPVQLEGLVERHVSVHWPRSKARKLPILASTYLFSRAPFAPLQFGVQRFRNLVAQAVATGDFDLVQINGMIVSANVPQSLPASRGHPLLVTDAVNVEADRLARQARVAASPVARAFYACEARRMRRWETHFLRSMAGITAVSEVDAAAFREIATGVPVAIAPNGVDLEHYRLGTAPRVADRMLYVGAMDYMPNADAIGWFCADILPLITRACPSARVSVIGRRGESIPELQQHQNVTAFGLVDDVQPHYATCGVFVVPLRAGGGTRLKIMEALACGCPVVSTSVGAEGIPVQHGEHLLIADTAEEFAAAVLSLIADPARAKQLGECGSAFVRERFGWDSVAAGMLRFYETLLREA